MFQHPSVQDDVNGLFRRKYHSNAKKPISLEHQLELLKTLAQKFAVFTIVIDALDECKEPDEYVEGLTSILTLPWVVVRVFVTGRNEYALQRTLGALAIYQIPLGENVGRDIEVFVADEVKSRVESRRLKVRSHVLKQHIIHVLSTRAQGM